MSCPDLVDKDSSRWMDVGSRESGVGVGVAEWELGIGKKTGAG